MAQLPQNWEECYTNEGELYYRNHDDETTHWHLPGEESSQEDDEDQGREDHEHHAQPLENAEHTEFDWDASSSDSCDEAAPFIPEQNADRRTSKRMLKCMFATPQGMAAFVRSLPIGAALTPSALDKSVMWRLVNKQFAKVWAPLSSIYWGGIIHNGLQSVRSRRDLARVRLRNHRFFLATRCVAACRSVWGAGLPMATAEDILAIFGAAEDDDDDFMSLAEPRHELFGWKERDTTNHDFEVHHVKTVSHFGVNVTVTVGVDLDMYVSITVFGASCPSRAMQRRGLPITFAKARIENA